MKIDATKLIESLDKSIIFHNANQNDPYGISNAVITALREVRDAVCYAAGAPRCEEHRVREAVLEFINPAEIKKNI